MGNALRIHTHPYKSDFSGSNLIPRVGFNHQTFQVPKMEESSPIQAVCKAYVREHPSPQWPYEVQYLHFRYLKLLVIQDVPSFRNGRIAGNS